MCYYSCIVSVTDDKCGMDHKGADVHRPVVWAVMEMSYYASKSLSVRSLFIALESE